MLQRMCMYVRLSVPPAIAVFTDGERLDSKDIVDNISSLVTSYKPNNISLFIFIIVPGKIWGCGTKGCGTKGCGTK